MLSREKIYLALKTLPLKQKVVFLFLVLVFLIGFFGILRNINSYFSVEIPKAGGTIKEGIVGIPRFINPLLEISDVDRDVTSLIYSGLMRPDGKGGLTFDLAEKYEASEDGLSYTFTLKEGVLFHDGEPVTTDDIIFTIEQVKDPALKSPKRASWEGVEVEKIDDLNFKFILEQPYAPFLENTTLGILPKHIWKEASLYQMSFSEFNIKPIGSGPYKLDKIKRNSSGVVTSYALEANKSFALGKPYIKKLIIKFYPNEEKLVKAFRNGDVETVGGISSEKIIGLQKTKYKLKALSLPRVFAAFFNQNNAPVFAKTEVRKALNRAVDKEKIVAEVLKGFGVTINSPIPPGTFGTELLDPPSALTGEDGEPSTREERLEAARAILTGNGWKFDEEENLFIKKSKKETLRLEFSISTSDTPELKQTAELLKSMWEEFGAKVELKIFEVGDLNQNVIRPRKYDILLFGEILGRDPDPFAFWHSSQRNDPGLNIALYANITVDKLLEKARVSQDSKDRKEKYLKFQEEVRNDLPAVFLYSPFYMYLTPEELKGFDTKNIVLPSERFSNIYNWHLKTKKVWKIFVN